MTMGKMLVIIMFIIPVMVIMVVVDTNSVDYKKSCRKRSLSLTINMFFMLQSIVKYNVYHELNKSMCKSLEYEI